MDIAALISWIVTAGGGFVLLATWIGKGGAVRRAGTSRSHLPPAVIFGHFALAAIGLVVWIVYVVSDEDALAWVAFVLLVPVAALGFVMFGRWLAVRRARRPVAVGAGTRDLLQSRDGAPAESHFPIAVVGAHGLLAVLTVVLVLLTALGVGGS